MPPQDKADAVQNISFDKERKNAYEITTEVVNGTISGGGTAFYGENKTVLFEPEDGYMIASVEIDGIEMNVEDFRGRVS